MADSFTYGSVSVAANQQDVSLSYKVDHEGNSYQFTEQFTFPLALPDSYETRQLLRVLHLACGISYYKIFVPETLVHPYAMSDAEAVFWNSVFVGGLSEFLYVNQLDPARVATFSEQDGARTEGGPGLVLNDAALLGIGGGKDSIVGGEVLKKAGVPTEGFVMATGEALGQSQAVAATMGFPLHAIQRRLDPTLLQVQSLPGAYKGHIPISLIFALVGALLGVAQGKGLVAVANEASASTPQTEWAGGVVNHQWSKSEVFEGQLQAYIHENVSPQLTYFSVIRPLGSVGVAKAFSRFPAYFEVFTSDNFVFRQDPAQRPHARWSLESPKSLSSFLLLSPWLDEPSMLRIFGTNFLQHSELKELFLSSLGLAGDPPLDCVGTPDELSASLGELIRQGKWQGSSLLHLPELEGVPSDDLGSMAVVGTTHHFPAALQDTILSILKEFVA